MDDRKIVKNELNNSTTTLHPFLHQVGGHTQLMLLDETTICKPLIQRELLFYLNIPVALNEFVPSYKGVVQVRQVDGIPILHHPLKNRVSHRLTTTTTTATATATATVTATATTTAPVPVATATANGSSGYLNGSSSLCSPTTVQVLQPLVSEERTSRSNGLNVSTEPQVSNCHSEFKVQLSSCNERCLLQKELSSVDSCNRNSTELRYSTRPSQRYFLLLENITSKYHLPCILDLKMGTRQHDDEATDEKRSRQMAKCAASTSALLGFRLGGMQVYQVESRTYLVKDKYYGRKLDALGLREALRMFFHNGFTLRKRVISLVINKLKALRQAVEHQTEFRFYTTSLLIVYEGCVGWRRTYQLGRASSTQASEDDSSMDTDDYYPKMFSRSKACKPKSNLSRIRHSSSSGDDEDSSLDNSIELNRPSINLMKAAKTDESCMECYYHYDSLYSNHNSSNHHQCHQNPHHDQYYSNQKLQLQPQPQQQQQQPQKQQQQQQLNSNSYSHHSMNSFSPQSKEQQQQQQQQKYSNQHESSQVSFKCQRSHHYFDQKRMPVDVRIIDFAHTVLSSHLNAGNCAREKSIDRHGPDVGFLLGLDSLLKMLLDVREEACLDDDYDDEYNYEHEDSDVDDTNGPT